MTMRIPFQGFFLLSALFALVSAGGARASELDAVTGDDLLAAYAPVHAPLVTDELEKAQAGAKVLQAVAAKWLSENPTHALKAQVEGIQHGAGALVGVDSLDDARIAFVEISQGAIAVIRADEGLKAKWQLFFCPMVAKKQGYWVQPQGEELANPFMGGMMPGCGSKKPW